MTPDEVFAWMMENPGWMTSREIWTRAGYGRLSFHHLRSRIQSLLGKGRIMRRVKHARFDKPAHSGRKWSYGGPVYEYRRVVNLDS